MPSILPQRGSARAALALILAALAWGATWLDGWRLNAGGQPHEALDLVQRLDLTDLALFNEARYTRHPSQADRHAAFQDHPMALEHFPAGSVMPPPRRTEAP